MNKRHSTLAWFVAASNLAAQLVIGQPAIHTFSGIEVPANANGLIQLTLSGNAPPSVRSFFDTYPVERSADLQSWEPPLLVVRTNASTNILQVEFASSSPAAFFRMPTNHFVTPLPKPTGQYAVGVINRLLTDPTRTNRYGIKTNSSFMATIWYPAVARPGLYLSWFSVNWKVGL